METFLKRAPAARKTWRRMRYLFVKFLFYCRLAFPKDFQVALHNSKTSKSRANAIKSYYYCFIVFQKTFFQLTDLRNDHSSNDVGNISNLVVNSLLSCLFSSVHKGHFFFGSQAASVVSPFPDTQDQSLLGRHLFLDRDTERSRIPKDLRSILKTQIVDVDSD